MYYKHESDPLFIGDKENGYKDFTVFELLKFLSSFINFATIQSLYSHTVFDFDFEHSPLAKFMLCVCLIKNSPQKPNGKKG